MLLTLMIPYIITEMPSLYRLFETLPLFTNFLCTKMLKTQLFKFSSTTQRTKYNQNNFLLLSKIL